MRSFNRAIVLVLLVSLVALPGFARGKKGGSTEAGKYTDWQGEIDELEIVEPFDMADYEKLVVTKFDTSSAKLPDEKDNSYKPAVKVLEDAATPFTKGLAAEMKSVAVEQGGKSKAAKTILLEVSVKELDPGSKAARYWAGFGAGAARAKVTGEAVDASTGKVLFRFTQERRSGVGMMGGGYEDLLDRDLHQIGEDVARILNSFQR